MSNRHRATLAQETDALKTALLPPAKPKSMLEAQERLAAMRRCRDHINGRIKSASDRANSLPTKDDAPRLTTDQIKRLAVELDEAQGEVHAAQKVHRTEMDLYAGLVIDSAMPHLPIARGLIADLVRHLDEALLPLDTLHAAVGDKATRLVQAAPELRALVRGMRQILNAT